MGETASDVYVYVRMIMWSTSDDIIPWEAPIYLQVMLVVKTVRN